MQWLRTATTSSRLIAVLLTTSILFAVNAPVAEASVRLCGQRLTSTLLAICRNQLCGMGTFKRSPWIAPSSRELMQIHHAQKRGGIATECCEKRCSFSYLKTYCCNTD